MYKKFNMTVCETSNTVLSVLDLQNVQLIRTLQEYDMSLSSYLSKLGVNLFIVLMLDGSKPWTIQKQYCIGQVEI